MSDTSPFPFMVKCIAHIVRTRWESKDYETVMCQYLGTGNWNVVPLYYKWTDKEKLWMRPLVVTGDLQRQDKIMAKASGKIHRDSYAVDKLPPDEEVLGQPAMDFLDNFFT